MTFTFAKAERSDFSSKEASHFKSFTKVFFNGEFIGTVAKDFTADAWRVSGNTWGWRTRQEAAESIKR